MSVRLRGRWRSEKALYFFNFLSRKGYSVRKSNLIFSKSKSVSTVQLKIWNKVSKSKRLVQGSESFFEKSKLLNFGPRKSSQDNVLIFARQNSSDGVTGRALRQVWPVNCLQNRGKAPGRLLLGARLTRSFSPSPRIHNLQRYVLEKKLYCMLKIKTAPIKTFNRESWPLVTPSNHNISLINY